MRLISDLARYGIQLMLSFSLAGCAVNGVKHDPLEPLNRAVYQFNDVADKAVIKPLAEGYQAVIPSPVRTGVTNFFSNLDDVVIAFNDLLQFKFAQATSDTTRVLTNTIFGMLGIFDVATGWGMDKHEEDFGQTLGTWGVGNGPYLVLPLLGPSNLRDATGLFLVDVNIHPAMLIDPVSDRNATVAFRFFNTRTNLLGVEKILDEAALDPYAFVRDGYLQRRRSLIFDGNPPPGSIDEEDM